MKSFFYTGLTALALIYSPNVIAAETSCNWTGTWETPFGKVLMVHVDDQVVGDVVQIESALTAKVDQNCNLAGNFKQGKSHRNFTVTLNRETYSSIWKFDSDRSSQDIPKLQYIDVPVSKSILLGATQGGFGAAQGIRMSGPSGTSNMAISEVLAMNKKAEDARAAQERRDQARARAQVQRARAQARRERHARIQKAKIAAARKKASANNTKSRKWQVNLESVCLVTYADNDMAVDFEEIYGNAWIKARIINKTNNRQIDLAPIGGFPRVSGDKERAWSRGPNEYLNLREGRCKSVDVSYTYEFDAVKYGYANVAEMLKDDRNRIDVMFKLQEVDTLSPNDNLGTYRAATSIADSDFCGKCETAGNKLPSRTGGNGVLSGFRDGGTTARVYYSIRPVVQ